MRQLPSPRTRGISWYDLLALSALLSTGIVGIWCFGAQIREKENATRCKGNLRQWGTAFLIVQECRHTRPVLRQADWFLSLDSATADTQHPLSCPSLLKSLRRGDGYRLNESLFRSTSYQPVMPEKNIWLFDGLSPERKEEGLDPQWSPAANRHLGGAHGLAMDGSVMYWDHPNQGSVD